MDEEKVIMKAYADIQGNGVSGKADFVEIEKGTQRFVRVTVYVKGNPTVLAPGLHGFHIHEKGVCEPPFMSAGGHFDPGPAGNTDPDANHPYHMGDLPNIKVDENGEGHLEAITTRITLSDGPLSILTPEGTSVMLHKHSDAEECGPSKSGVSGGPRLACGVIKSTT